jgi:hypothetical protein
MWIAIAVDMAMYALVGIIIVRLGKRFLPEPWNQPSFTIPVVLVIGALITLATFPHWLVFPR